jgi:hypothetical protein
MKLLIRQTVEAEMEFDSIEAAIEWAGEHTVFDLLDRNAAVWRATIHDPFDGGQVGEA